MMLMNLTPYSRQLLTDYCTVNSYLRLNVDNSAAIATNTVQLNDGSWLKYGAGYGNGGYGVYQDAVDFGEVTDTVTIASYELMAYYDGQDGSGYQLQPMMSGTFEPPLIFNAGDRLVIPAPTLTIDW